MFKYLLKTRLVTHTKLVRLVPFTHYPKCSVLQFSTKATATNCGGEQSPATGSKFGNEKGESKRCRVELPKELSKDVILLSCESTAEGGVCDIYVVGTVHVSEESSKQVEAIVKFLKPETVFLELCSSRLNVLFRDQIKVPTVEEVIEKLKKKHNIFGVLFNWAYAEFWSELGVYPGAEFRSAYREAIKYGGKVVLGDRPLQITLKRTWSKLPLWHIPKFLTQPFPSSLSLSFSLATSDDLKKLLKELEDDDKLNLMRQNMSRMLPTVMETLVHERDQYMSYTLLKVASERRSVVAVVGKGHLQGIKQNWKQSVKIQDLMTVPPPKPPIFTMKFFASVSVAVAGVAIISSLYL